MMRYVDYVYILEDVGVDKINIHSGPATGVMTSLLKFIYFTFVNQ